MLLLFCSGCVCAWWVGGAPAAIAPLTCSREWQSSLFVSCSALQWLFLANAPLLCFCRRMSVSLWFESRLAVAGVLCTLACCTVLFLFNVLFSAVIWCVPFLMVNKLLSFFS
jgi:hypothetical protein